MGTNYKTDAMLARVWDAEFVVKHYCGLCGNHGIIDTRGTKAPNGEECGGVFFCICPNGRKMKQLSGKTAIELLEEK